jgi:predicted CopG family antitoxin
LAYHLTMSAITVTIESEAYELLTSRKRPSESLSEAIVRELSPEPRSRGARLADWFEARRLRGESMSEEELDALDRDQENDMNAGLAYLE